jgi:hypothetical protein
MAEASRESEEGLATEEKLHARLRRRTAVGGAVIFLIPFLLFTILLRVTSESYIRRQTLERLETGAAANARLLEDVLALRTQEAASLGNLLAAEPLTAGTIRLRQFVANHPWFETAGITDKELTSRGQRRARQNSKPAGRKLWPIALRRVRD